VSALVRLGLRLAGGGGARERGRSLSVAAAAGAGTWALLVTLSVVDAVLDTLGAAYGDQEMATLAGGVLIAVGVPVVVLVATAARLSASVRDRRLASLRLIGLPPTSTRLVAAVEVGAATLVGALAGVVAFVASRSSLPSVRFDGLVVDTGSTGAMQIVGVPLVVLLVSVAVAQAPTRRRAGQALASVRAAETRRVAWWRVAPVVAGLALLVALRVAVRGDAEVTTAQAYTLFVGAGLTGLGMLVLLPVVVRLVAAALVRIPGAPAVRLAGRRMQAQPAGVQRVVAGLLAALFVVAGARMVLVAFEVSDGAYAAARSAMDGGPQPLSVRTTRPSEDAVEAALRAHPLVDRVATQDQLATGCRGARSLCLTAFVGTCAELVEALPGVTGCRDDEAALLGDEVLVGGRTPGPTLTWRANGSAGTLSVPTPQTTLSYDYSTEQDLVYANVFLPQSTPGVEDLLNAGQPSWSVSAHGGPSAAAQVQTALRDVSPHASVSRDWRKADLAYVDTMKRGLWLLAGLVVSVGLLSFVLGGVDRALSRRAESARLQVFGTPRRTIMAAQWIEALLPLLVGVPLAAGLGSFAGETFLSLAERSMATPWTGIVTVVLATLLGSVVVAGLTVVAAAPRLRADLIRAE
jgi:putative ABC transport system permease protein